MMAEGEREEVLIPLANVPLTRGGRLGFQVENVLAAAAAAEALGVPHEAVRAALEGFRQRHGAGPGPVQRRGVRRRDLDPRLRP